MFKILFGFVIIGSINATNIRFKRGDDYVDEQERLESKYSEDLINDIINNNNIMKSDDYSSIQKNYDSEPIKAAIKTKRYNRLIPFSSSNEEVIPQVVEIAPYRQPFKFIFQTESNPLSVEQIHSGLPGHTEETQSMDEPHRVTHRVFRPVIQEISEIIQPYRRFRQEIRPVLQESYTIVSKRDRSGEMSNSIQKKGQVLTGADIGSQKVDYSQLQEEQNIKVADREYSMSLDTNYSDRKRKYQLEDSSEQKLKESQQNLPSMPYTPELSSILDQMKNIMSGQNIRSKLPPEIYDVLTPFSYSNSGKLTRRERTPIYSD